MVDHLVPHKGDEKLFQASGNHIPLCAKCHNTVTGKFDYKYSTGGSIEEKTSWMNTERQKNQFLLDKKFPLVMVVNYSE